MEKKNQDINRREFLKRLGVGASAAAALNACGTDTGNGSGKSATLEVPTDGMTYRINPKTNEKVSILGYGCMRWPMMKDPNNSDNEIVDQEAVNGLVDYALGHGINYFDTAPPYVRGLSETASGIALSRHPRDSYYLATKMSNHHSGSPLSAFSGLKFSFTVLS